MKRREFLIFFVLGGIFSLFGKKIKDGDKKSRVAMFWRRVK